MQLNLLAESLGVISLNVWHIVISLLNLVILWVISVYLGFRLGREQKHQKKKIKK